jgi:hypothetical protein
VNVAVGKVTTIGREPAFATPATGVATRVSVMDAERAAGGVYTVEVLGPVVLILPQGAPLQPVPVNCQVTFWLGSYGSNCSVTVKAAVPAATDGAGGLNETDAGL